MSDFMRSCRSRRDRTQNGQFYGSIWSQAKKMLRINRGKNIK